MISTDLNGTMTVLANTTESPRTECKELENFEWVYTYQPPYMWFIFILGFLENLFVISVFVLHKSRCTVAEIYLGNMAAADLIFVSGLPFWAIFISNKFYWPFGGFMCKAVGSLNLLNLYSSIYFLLMVSIDRYLALVKTMSIGRLRRPWLAKVNCGIIWLFAAVLSVPSIVFRKTMFIPELNTTACINDLTPNWSMTMNILLTLLGFLVPLVIITFCTIQMIRVLKNNAMQQFKEVNNEKKATWLVLSVLLVFIVCWLPFHVSTIIEILDKGNVFPPCTVTSMNHVFTQISTYIGYSNSCINPVMYVMVGNHFRQKAKAVYCRLLGKGHDRRKSSFPTDESVNSTQISFTMGPYKKKSIA